MVYGSNSPTMNMDSSQIMLEIKKSMKCWKFQGVGGYNNSTQYPRKGCLKVGVSLIGEVWIKIIIDDLSNTM